MNRIYTTCLFGGVLAALSGCSSLSGYESSSKFSCAAAPGVTCQSVSGISQNADAGTLPFQRGVSKKNGDSTGRNSSNSDDANNEDLPDRLKKNRMSPADMRAAFTGEPLRAPPLLLRVWVAPFEDEDGNLHDQGFFYTQVHDGRWMLESTQARITARNRPVYMIENSSRSMSKELSELPSSSQSASKQGKQATSSRPNTNSADQIGELD